jgi:circadian clock protein KaiB
MTGAGAVEGNPVPVPGAAPEARVCRFRLYIAGRTPKALLAHENLKRFCADRLRGRCVIEVIDLVASPHLAVEEQIIAIPTLVAIRPSGPDTRLVGDLSDTGRVAAALGLRGAER